MLNQLERLIRRDPARRGLIASETRFGPLVPGHLARAVGDLTDRARRVVLTTGFFIPGGTPPAAETDGPLGTLLLADVLERAGVATLIVTDRNCRSALLAAARAFGYPSVSIREYPFPAFSDEGDDAAKPWRLAFADEQLRLGLTHLIAIERVGPSHTQASLQAQVRRGPAPLADFRQGVSAEQEGRCHNMRGDAIDQYTGNLHLLFEELPARIPGLRTIGVGDGANEIGMGSIPWEDLSRRLAGPQAARVPCRIACDWTIVAGISNWGGYALAAGFAWKRHQLELLERHTVELHRRALQELVFQGPAVDGVTRQQTESVDGLDFANFIQPWQEMRQLLGLEMGENELRPV